MYTKESLETLRNRIDLIEVIQPYVELKRSGVVHKGLCPFHDEKTPSFNIQKGDRHYHCFGCGAHGDAIQFLMSYLSQGFSEAVETLAEKFHVTLDKVEGRGDYTGPSPTLLKQALDTASRFYHFYLLHTNEGHEALQYLYNRGIDLEFIRRFNIGLAPKSGGIFRKAMHEKKISDEILVAAGLARITDSSGTRDFFTDRITFPIYNPVGAVIGFSARKYKEETFGGKYVNTPETPLFKKSRVLFGLNHSRRRIAKEQRVIVVEGQIDALRLIYEGFDFTVAGQGTAFGEGHVQELLTLGVNQVFLALDSDEAGLEATCKIGDLFQKEGVDVQVILMPSGSDPDSYLKENGAEAFLNLIENSKNYLDFLIEFRRRAINIETPAGKNVLINMITGQICRWKQPIMVHESLRKLAHSLHVPEHMVTVGVDYSPNIYVRKEASIGLQTINPTKILESDFLIWILKFGGSDPFYMKVAKENIDENSFKDGACQRIYRTYLALIEKGSVPDMLSLITEEEDQILIEDMMKKKIDVEKGRDLYLKTLERILNRNWMEKREEVRRLIDAADPNGSEVIDLMKKLNQIVVDVPKLKIPVDHL